MLRVGEFAFSITWTACRRYIDTVAQTCRSKTPYDLGCRNETLALSQTSDLVLAFHIETSGSLLSSDALRNSAIIIFVGDSL